MNIDESASERTNFDMKEKHYQLYLFLYEHLCIVNSLSNYDKKNSRDTWRCFFPFAVSSLFLTEKRTYIY